MEIEIMPYLDPTTMTLEELIGYLNNYDTIDTEVARRLRLLTARAEAAEAREAELREALERAKPLLEVTATYIVMAERMGDAARAECAAKLAVYQQVCAALAVTPPRPRDPE